MLTGDLAKLAGKASEMATRVATKVEAGALTHAEGAREGGFVMIVQVTRYPTGTERCPRCYARPGERHDPMLCRPSVYGETWQPEPVDPDNARVDGA